MKGLIIKDFKLIKVQKNFLFMMFLVAISLTMFSTNISFPLGYFTFVISLLVVSSISFDEFDNGNAFLFSLPITRSGYVFEKYCFSIILSVGALLVSLTFVTIISRFIHQTAFLDIILTALVILPITILIQSIMIPLHLKFGGERGKIAMLIIFGIVFAAGFIFFRLTEGLHSDMTDFLTAINGISIGTIIAIFLCISLIGLLLSFKISNSIMRKKEF